MRACKMLSTHHRSCLLLQIHIVKTQNAMRSRPHPKIGGPEAESVCMSTVTSDPCGSQAHASTQSPKTVTSPFLETNQAQQPTYMRQAPLQAITTQRIACCSAQARDFMPAAKGTSRACKLNLPNSILLDIPGAGAHHALGRHLDRVMLCCAGAIPCGSIQARPLGRAVQGFKRVLPLLGARPGIPGSPQAEHAAARRVAARC